MPKPILLIDNYDSFTYMLADYIEQCQVECIVVRNDEPALLDLNPNNFLALVISPGPETPQLAGKLMQVIPSFLGTIPVLGICLGHQAIGIHYGAVLTKAKIPRHGKVDTMKHFGHPIFEEIPHNFEATRYHSLILKDLPEILEPICNCEEELMGLKHSSLPVFGLQFHPESCQTEGGLQIIKNFINLAKRLTQM